MRRPSTVDGQRSTRAGGETPVLAGDCGWPGRLRFAAGSSVAFFAALMLVDAGTGQLRWWRALIWGSLGLAVFAVLLPPRVTAGVGWIGVRGLFRERRVCTDRLTVLQWNRSTVPQLLLRDVHGAWLELDPQVLEANPLVWHLIESGARRSARRCDLQQGADVLLEMSRRVDGTALHPLRDGLPVLEPDRRRGPVEHDHDVRPSRRRRRGERRASGG